MPKAARIFSDFSTAFYTEKSAIPAKRSDTSEFIVVAIFSLHRLVHSLIARHPGCAGAWF